MSNNDSQPQRGAHKKRKLRVLVASTSAPSPWLLEKLVRQLLEADVEPIVICDSNIKQDASIIVKSIARDNTAPKHDGTTESSKCEAARLADWAELLILAPIDANALAKMLHGITDNLMLEVLRSWDVCKKILLIPGMSGAAWENPMTRKQLSKIRRKWKWITVLQPLLWKYTKSSRQHYDPVEDDLSLGAGPQREVVVEWDGMDELLGAVKNQLDLATIGHNVDVEKLSYRHSMATKVGNGSAPPLPPELWSIILEHTNDWELAQALNVRTNLPVPTQWHLHVYSPRTRDAASSESFHRRLEWALLHADLKSSKNLLAATTPLPKYLSRLSIQMIMRWALIPLLLHLETSHKELFWTAFGHSFIPNKASSVFGRVELLEYWRTSPSFLTKEYTDEAMDQASANGYVHILEWWKRSGLTLKYTEVALEIASGRGHLEVLEWWRQNSKYAPERRDSASSDTSSAPPSPTDHDRSHQGDSLLELKPGRSISNATQAGHLPILHWWAHSTIPFSHEDTILKLASAHGHVHILSFWLSHRSNPSQLQYDNTILVAPTKLGHANVLQWWKEQARRGLRVEYKICDVEEALEDAGGGRGSEEVRRWWARNGLNLGVGTSEWMRVKVLQ